ncbi:hypothetical protein LY39_03645 [Roseinatronobacter bogoriensis subsp. barguzinensis]|nr:hypothetical protein [Rhodobaca bogoriensis DSM 18756]TDW33132.1 hypothetical protein LY39_03645 [Rhodobaca barguzinensis]TDY65962.1 hypothetical protein EV660_11525 [Rhodobaca bogoriensis DSM 18756]
MTPRETRTAAMVDLLPTLPRERDRVVAKCMRTKPADRTQHPFARGSTALTREII